MFDRLFNLPLQSKDSFLVLGPRGTGKTFWIKNNINPADYIYIDLLDPAVYRQLQANPEKLRIYFPKGYSGRIVIDEVQKIPQLMDEIHRLIEQENIRFLLTGSSARKLKRDGTNLLAGRALKYIMHPLIFQEIPDKFDLTFALTYGMLPSVYQYDDPKKYIATYVDIYLREEVLQEGLTRNISAFARFLEIASFSQGNVYNTSEIAREIGVDRQVVQNYFSVLQDLLLAHSLPVFTKRAKRKLIASNKFYYFDAGVYYHLRPKGILDSPQEMAGPGLETLFYQSLLALIDYYHLDEKVYYWRTVNGVEVDFIVYGENNFLGFEIKHAKTITSKTLIGLKKFSEDYPMAKLYLVYLGEKILHLANVTALPFVEALRQLPTLLQIQKSEQVFINE